MRLISIIIKTLSNPGEKRNFFNLKKNNNKNLYIYRIPIDNILMVKDGMLFL